MQTFLRILKDLPVALLRVAHVIKHLFCDLNSCDKEE